MNPYSDTIKDGYIIREFSDKVSNFELVWHRDKKDRWVVCEHDTDWKFQLDNELPVSLQATKLFIPKETYHRLIKGSGTLTLKIQEVG